MVLVRRSEGGAHGGQLAFPGGKPDPDDGSMLQTALREAWEEIGISPEAVEVLAHLPPTDTRTSGFRIFPFLARITPPVQWHRNEREVAEILDVRLADLALPEAHGEEVKADTDSAGAAANPVLPRRTLSAVGRHVSHSSSSDPASAGRRMEGVSVSFHALER